MAQTTRELVLARRKAMSASGKAGLPGGGHAAPVRASVRPVDNRSAAGTASAPTTTPTETAGAVHSPSNTGRAASLARRRTASAHGKVDLQSKDLTRNANVAATTTVPAPGSNTIAEGNDCDRDGERVELGSHIARPASPLSCGLTINKPRVPVSAARAASRARRQLTSSRGKAGINENGMSSAQAARAGNPDMSSRDMSKAVREQRSKNGGLSRKQSRPCGRVRPLKNSATGAARDVPWKAGAGETVSGQIVTGTMVGRSPDVTGDEASTCRTITGTEYLGADIFRDFCQTGTMPHMVNKVAVTTTSHGNSVIADRMGRGEGVAVKGSKITGDSVGRSAKITGDESGMNRELTGTRYTVPTDIGNAPAKVGMSATLRGSSVTGTMIGRRDHTTDDESKSCHNITGDDYIGQEQFGGFCRAMPAPQDQKLDVSPTNRGSAVTGTMMGRSGRVTGDEPGTCKAVTGTPYAGLDQAATYCEAPAVTEIEARARPLAGTPGPVMTGWQPSVGGVMTGADKGVCEPVTGTPYIGADQLTDACPATPADTASPDFPQILDGAPWGQFSVTPPSGGAVHAEGATGVTGNRFEARRDITGPFGMASGKVTGTEEVRFGARIQSDEPRPVVAKELEGRTKARITGEGQDAGLKITGNDWVRGRHVTGTEGRSAMLRNPTICMSMAGTMAVEQKRNEELPIPDSKVTGGSGNTEKGSLVTYSGGARG